MKSGSGDDLWGKSDDESEPDEESTEAPISAESAVVEGGSGPTNPRGSTSESTLQNSSDQSESRSRLPHRVRCDSPKDGRIEKTILISQEDEARFDELQSLAKQTFDERVYKIDVYLAATRAGLEQSDEQFLETMRTIGYDYDHQ